MTRAAAAFSILFEDPEAAGALEGHETPDYFSDLNLDQVCDAVTAGRADYRLAPFFGLPLSDERAVEYRQGVFRDLEAGLSEAVAAFAEQMRRVRGHLAAAGQRRHPYEKTAWFLDAGHIYCGAVNSLNGDLARFNPASDGWSRCAAFLDGYVRSARFEALQAETARLKEELAAVRYCVRVRGSRVIVSEYQGEPDYSVEVLKTFEKFRQGDAKSRLVRFTDEFINHIQEQIVDRVAVLNPHLFRSLLVYFQTYAEFLDPVIARFDREVQFYLGYLGFIRHLKEAGLSFCYPEVPGSSKEVYAKDTFDIALAHKLVTQERPTVCNDLHLGPGERIFVVSGPNQGGKTTFARTFGQLHHLAALGCPVPGTRARLFLCDRIFAHFEKEEQMEDLHGKLQEELLRVREILRQATDRSVVIMNESLSSTTAEDALLLGREVIARLIELDVLAVYVTFIDELSRLGESVVSMVSTVVPENPAQRTFKVVRKPADGRAYATAIAEKHGLTYDSIRARLRS